MTRFIIDLQNHEPSRLSASTAQDFHSNKPRRFLLKRRHAQPQRSK
jgi:hypothetical protein